MNSRELLRFSPLTPQFFTILFTGIGTIVLLLGHLIIVSGWSMASHGFSVKYTEITNHGQKTEKSVKKSYNKVGRTGQWEFENVPLLGLRRALHPRPGQGPDVRTMA
jgi:hypothetical protein